jgi:hypothetical protein
MGNKVAVDKELEKMFSAVACFHATASLPCGVTEEQRDILVQTIAMLARAYGQFRDPCTRVELPQETYARRLPERPWEGGGLPRNPTPAKAVGVNGKMKSIS